MSSIPIDDLTRSLDLETLYCEEEHTAVDIDTSDINRPGLQFAGFFDYFASDRMQVLGKVEMNYLEQLNPVVRDERLDVYFSYDIPCLIVARDMEVPEYIMKYAKKYKRPVFSSKRVTTALINKLISYLDSQLAPRVTRHGVLVDVYGVGIFLAGESGIGKSETALELVKRGHRLVADDAVEIKKVAENRLIGESPELIRHFMEIRGIGIIDIKSMYGVGSVINNKPLDLVIYLEFWDEKKEYDRLGLSEEYTDILGVKLPKLVIPVRPGRNLAIIVEVAARNWRLKKLGYNAAKELDDRLNALIEMHNEEDDL
ncbi:HPr(Ser) kinase/phosphatase [Xylanivirga thermophila]|uniref:HPr(Ser) kinase/phosphatase n=1 Tax=Xylanivirga thermophila TaxID=2496273 RepID=UPI00101DDC73